MTWESGSRADPAPRCGTPGALGDCPADGERTVNADDERDDNMEDVDECEEKSVAEEADASGEEADEAKEEEGGGGGGENGEVRVGDAMEEDDEE